MSNSFYEFYLRSDAWKSKRLQVLEQDNWKCLMCDAIESGRYAKEDLQVHHRHYRNLGDEPLEDLSSICPECHDAITNVHRRRRYSDKKLSPSSEDFQVSKPIRVKTHGIDLSNFSTNRDGADHFTQWEDCKPIRSVGKSVKSYFEQAKKSGCRDPTLPQKSTHQSFGQREQRR